MGTASKGHRPVEVEVHEGIAISTRAGDPALYKWTLCWLIHARTITYQELDRCINTGLRLAIPIDQQARVAKAHLLREGHTEGEGSYLAGTRQIGYWCCRVAYQAHITTCD